LAYISDYSDEILIRDIIDDKTEGGEFRLTANEALNILSPLLKKQAEMKKKEMDEKETKEESSSQKD
jgi:hypothetical protein